ncbi:MAG: DNA mismatch repair protein MutS [Clostridiales bacterium]|nr:DNA mismatch repair protein MutS [Clostridiales bacterium]
MSNPAESELILLKDINKEDLSPMMQQYYDMKLRLGDTILFYRLGDFYEMFFDDAVYVSKLLELALTRRDCGNNKRAPMCGVPFHAYKSYANKLVASGHKVAICEQLEDPALAKGLVKRGIIKVLTPGTLTDSEGLEEGKNNYLMSINCVGKQFGVAVCDISTGEFEATELTFLDNGEHLMNLIGKYLPSEIIHNRAFEDTNEYNAIRIGFNSVYTERADREFSSAALKGDKSVSIIDLNMFDDPVLLLGAANAVLCYAKETQTDEISHLNHIKCFKISDTMELDYSTRINLELTATIRSKTRRGSLLWAIDKTKTAMGGRLLRKFVEEPLVNTAAINARLDAVEEALNKFIKRQEIIESLTGLYDIERLAGKVSLGSLNARDLISLRNSLGKIPFIAEAVADFSKGSFREIKQNLKPLDDIYELLDKAINEDAPVTLKDGDLIKRGFSKECDELYEIATNAKSYIMQLEASEREKTGIKTLKIGYNRVFGYYIEVPRSRAEDVPEEYVRKQTLANNERYITPQIKELEDKILSASSRRIALEYELFTQIRDTVNSKASEIFKLASSIALLDVITSLAELASTENYVRPTVDNSEVIDIKEGRHPVVAKMTDDPAGFIPNDTVLDSDKRLMVLTGPNMAGKSTYMRQVALIVLLAQIGSFVPAKSARIGLVDHIFTRIGSSDDISSGQSTFMVEMKEVSYILKNATRKSLLLLDEVGRGTSTYDGLSIAWAVIEYIIDPNILYARTVFATHYHELNQLAKLSKGVFNNHVDVKETPTGVVFLHKIVDGGTSDSYGIEVARLAGLPSDLLVRAGSILKELERIGNFKVNGNVDYTGGSPELTSEVMPGQESFFNPDNIVYRKEDKIRSLVRDIDITKLTPLEAMNILYGLTEAVKEEDNGQD